MSFGIHSSIRGINGTLTVEHLWLTGAAMLFATAIAVPAGVWLDAHTQLGQAGDCVLRISCRPFRRWQCLAFCCRCRGLVNARLALPSFALTAYALLPILRNTYAGIRGIEPSVIEVARALGLTDTQRLFKVELPLAASFILTSLRTATVTCIGIATIAAAVGAGGLGELIFRGVASVDNRLVLAGAVPAALLALGADASLGASGAQVQGSRFMNRRSDCCVDHGIALSSWLPAVHRPGPTILSLVRRTSRSKSSWVNCWRRRLKPRLVSRLNADFIWRGVTYAIRRWLQAESMPTWNIRARRSPQF